MARSTTKTKSIQLNEQVDPDRKVLVTTQDEDRFSLTCSQAIDACKVHLGRKAWFDELDILLGRVRQWCEESSPLVFAAYAAARDGRVVIFVVPASDSYDLVLGGKLSELDLEIAQKFQVIPTEVLQIPGKNRDQLETFVDPQLAKFIYGQTSGSSEPVASQS